MGYYTYLALTTTLALLVSRLQAPALLKLVLATMYCMSWAAFAVDILVWNRYVDEDKMLSTYPAELRRPRVALRVCSSYVLSSQLYSVAIRLLIQSNHFGSGIAQSLVIWRCLGLWKNNRVAILLCAILLASSWGTGVYSISFRPGQIPIAVTAYNWTNIASTAMSSAIVILRTLWMKRQVNKLYGVTDCYSIVGMVLDSGIMYPLVALIDRFIPGWPMVRALVQLAGITAGRIILQTALGRNAPDVNSLLKAVRESERSTTPVLDTIFGSAIDPSLHGVNRTPSLLSQAPGALREGEPSTSQAENKGTSLAQSIPPLPTSIAATQSSPV